jgi:hypothetical protein
MPLPQLLPIVPGAVGAAAVPAAEVPAPVAPVDAAPGVTLLLEPLRDKPSPEPDGQDCACAMLADPSSKTSSVDNDVFMMPPSVSGE